MRFIQRIRILMRCCLGSGQESEETCEVKGHFEPDQLASVGWEGRDGGAWWGHEQMLLVLGAASPLESGKTKPAQPQLSTAMQVIWEAVGHLSAESLVLHQQLNLTGKVPSFLTAVAESAATLENSLPIPLLQGDLCGPHVPFRGRPGLLPSHSALLCSWASDGRMGLCFCFFWGQDRALLKGSPPRFSGAEASWARWGPAAAGGAFLCSMSPGVLCGRWQCAMRSWCRALAWAPSCPFCWPTFQSWEDRTLEVWGLDMYTLHLCLKQPGAFPGRSPFPL